MARIEVKTAEPGGELATTLLKRCDELIDNVRRRAYELFEQRRYRDGSAVDDWCRAEKELLFPAKCTVTQEPDSYNASLSIPGFTGKDLKMYTLGDRLVVTGETTGQSTGEGTSSTEERRSVYYQCSLPSGAQANKITAEIKPDGLMIKIPIEATPKAAQAA